MKRTSFAAVVCMLVAFQSVVGWAGTTGKIAGEVKDSQTGEAIVGASIVVEGTSFGAATNVDGYFVILNLPPGKYNLVGSSVGYSRQMVTGLTVSIDLTTTQNFSLSSTVVEGEEVVITAERPVIKKDLTSSESRVDASTIETLPVSEVSEVLSLQAGITTDRDGGIHIRGGRTSEVAYWVDGVSVSDVYDGGQAVQVDNNSVQELQVISGTFNAEYGQAMSGIVNIVTKDGGQQFHGSISTYVGDYVTSDGGKNDGREFLYDGSNPPDVLSDEIYYNLDKIRPLDNRNFEASLSGPIPEMPLTFYISGRYFKSNGWLYGNHVFYNDGMLDTNTIGILPGSIPGTAKLLIGDNPVPMNGRTRVSGQAKLTYQLSGTMKFSLSALASRIEYRDFSHDYKLMPDADVNKFDNGLNLSALWTHTLGSSAFYTINLSYFLKDFKEYLYEDIFNERYIVEDAPLLRQKNVEEFNKFGTNNHRFKRNTETRVAKIDYTDQVSSLHQIKAGLEGKLHRLYLEDYTLQDPATTGSRIPVRTSSLYEEYTQEPVELSAYLQDKLEYENMIVNVGLRVDYFDSKGLLPKDVNDPNMFNPAKVANRVDLNGDGVRSDEEQLDPAVLAARRTTWYRKASTKYSVSPRLGISYPITDRGVLHFSYGHFLQIPSFIHLYQKPDFKTLPTQSGVQGVYGNPDLKPQKTVMYEIGLQQQVAADLSLDVTAFYRDTRDWVTTSPPIGLRDPENNVSSYTMYVNRDYANSRGITISVNKRPTELISYNLSYTYQNAEGLNSNPDDALAAFNSNSQPAQDLTPLDWDQTHTANLTVGIGREDWGVYLLGRYGSGLPYTPTINQAEGRGEDAARVVSNNSRRRPVNYTVDLRLFKNIDVSPLNLSVFVKVFNLFDRRNEVDVFGQTGRATATPAQIGREGISGGNRTNTVESYLIRPDYYSEPREIQVGVEINY